MDLHKIVVTGGGSSAAIDRVRAEFSARGYRVLTDAETTSDPPEKALILCAGDAIEPRDGYDAVFYVMPAPDGQPLSAWIGHPHLRVIDGADSEAKARTLIAEIAAAIGDPEPLEIERKFLIGFPDLSRLNSSPLCRKIEIVQTYLKTEDGQEARIRKRGQDGAYLYTHTVKSSSRTARRTEIERRLTEDEYGRLLADALPGRQIRKTRYCLVYDAQYFEIDVYPFWTDRAIVEIELRAEDIPVRLPPEFHLIREVTGDPAYRNSALAEMINQ